MIDVFGAMNTEIADKQLAEKIFLNEHPNHELVKRILIHLATKSKSPHEVFNISKVLVRNYFSSSN